MLSYRVYSVDADGRIIKGDYLDAAGDSEAIELVRLRSEKTNCELWLGTRKVALIPADGGAAILFVGPQAIEAI